MRLVAFLLLASAAFDWELPLLDRPGVALLGLGVWALTGGPSARRARVPAELPFGSSAAGDDAGPEAGVRELARRLQGGLDSAARP